MVRTAPASAALMATLQVGRRAQYVVGGANVSGIPAAATGTAGTVAWSSAVTWSAVAIRGGYAPLTAVAVKIQFQQNRSAAGHAQGHVAPNSSYSYPYSSNPPPVYQGNYGSVFGYPIWLTLESNYLYWASDAAGGALLVHGWEDSI
jgi:hypothetical protein